MAIFRMPLRLWLIFDRTAISGRANCSVYIMGKTTKVASYLACLHVLVTHCPKYHIHMCCDSGQVESKDAEPVVSSGQAVVKLWSSV